MVKVGVLAFQGDVSEHLEMIEAVGGKPVPVKYPKEVEEIDGLILPGGESTTLGLLLKESQMDRAIKKRVLEGMPVWGTCMGAILLAKKLINNPIPQETLGLMNIAVLRNAYGRQRESFEEEISLEGIPGGPFPCVFIRAPYIEKMDPGVMTMGEFRGKIVLAREKNMLASSFHPEIAKDKRLHEYFLGMIEESLQGITHGRSNGKRG
jgi:5'-phosphate synthase pdxT subunit